MTPVRKMVVVNVAIVIDKETRELCSMDDVRPCRFIDHENNHCILFAKDLFVKAGGGYRRCKPCRNAEPV